MNEMMGMNAMNASKSLDDVMDELLKSVEEDLDTEELREQPAVLVAKALYKHIIDVHEFTKSQASRFIISANIAIWNKSSDVQIKKCIRISKKIVDKHFARFKRDFECSNDDICATASSFSIVLVPNIGES
jgi:hypothetical protein